jgi:hypothetical protein
MVEENGMSFPRVRSPENDQISLFDLAIRTRSPSYTENRRQTDDAGSMSGTVAAVDVVGPDDRSSELLRKIVHLIRCLRAAEDSEVLWSMPFHRTSKSLGGTMQCLFPGSRTETAVFTNQWLGQSGFTTFHDFPLEITLEFCRVLPEVIATELSNYLMSHAHS